MFDSTKILLDILLILVTNYIKKNRLSDPLSGYFMHVTTSGVKSRWVVHITRAPSAVCFAKRWTVTLGHHYCDQSRQVQILA